MKKSFLGKIICLLMAFAMVIGIVGCNNGSGSGGNNSTGGGSEGSGSEGSGSEGSGGEEEGGGSSEVTLTTNLTPTIYLAGDSTVQTYKTEQYIAGWGQYLSDFLGSDVEVVNCAKGGRSSRSFINEGRLYTYGNYSFSEHNRQSIEETIEAGDFLFIQFGHNDDDTKGYDTMYNRMVPLGAPDSKGVYPVTAPTNGAAGRDDGRNVTTYLPSVYTNNVSSTSAALTEIAKYGDYYYAYDCGGTYKWFLKQYIDFARMHDAIPVLMTPVARVSFNSDGTLKSGAGLHGENFAYVKAVRQLAEEENCLLIDNFAATKTMLETATKSDSDYFMALVDNDALTGSWPLGYDDTYANPEKYSKFTKVEATHYNKYGSYLTAAYIAAQILAQSETVAGTDAIPEYFTFSDHVKTTPNEFVNPSYLMSKSKVALVEALSIFSGITVTDPDRTYPDPLSVVSAITELTAVTVTTDNYEARKTAYNTVQGLYNTVNSEDRSGITNYDDLLEYGAKILNSKIAALLTGDASTVVTTANYKEYNATCKALRAEYEEFSTALKRTVITNVSILKDFEAAVKDNEPKVTRSVVLDLSSLTVDETITSAKTCGDFKVVGVSGKAVTVKGGISFTYNGKSYNSQRSLSMGGAAAFGSSRYIEFTTDETCRITVVAKSTGSDNRTLNLVSSSEVGEVVTTFAANSGSESITTYDNLEAGTYQLGSAGSGVYIYSIIIEYFS